MRIQFGSSEEAETAELSVGRSIEVRHCRICLTQAALGTAIS
jgi:hypothetical protein